MSFCLALSIICNQIEHVDIGRLANYVLFCVLADLYFRLIAGHIFFVQAKNFR